MSSFRMVTSYVYQAPPANFDFKTLQQLCNKKGITLTKYSDSQLQSTYSMQGFKASGQKINSICYVFISLLDDIILPVSTYYNGTLILTKNLRNQSQILELIQESLRIVESNFAGGIKIQDGFEELQRLFANLDKSSQKILQKQTNEMMAVQEIKSSSEYMEICQFAKKITEDLGARCKAAKVRENKSKFGHQNTIKEMMAVEELKQKVQTGLFKYSEIIKQASDIEGILTRLIGQKKEKMPVDFYDDETFLEYLSAATDIKRLENLKKYLNKA